MNSFNTKNAVIVFALILCLGFITVGCKQKTKDAWVNTNSMPGQTFRSTVNPKSNSSTIVYLGSDKNEPNVSFGPKDVSFDFRDLH